MTRGFEQHLSSYIVCMLKVDHAVKPLKKKKKCDLCSKQNCSKTSNRLVFKASVFKRHVCLRVWTYICMCMCVSMPLCVCMRACLYVCSCVRALTSVCMYFFRFCICSLGPHDLFCPIRNGVQRYRQPAHNICLLHIFHRQAKSAVVMHVICLLHIFHR